MDIKFNSGDEKFLSKIKELHKERFQDAENLHDEPELEPETYLDKYSGNESFVYEMMQNAGDAKATEIRFLFADDVIIVEHNGKHFTYKDLRAITGLYYSTKDKNNNTVGKFGIGFKSVYAFTDRPYICDYSVRKGKVASGLLLYIDKIIIPALCKMKDVPISDEDKKCYFRQKKEDATDVEDYLNYDRTVFVFKKPAGDKYQANWESLMNSLFEKNKEGNFIEDKNGNYIWRKELRTSLLFSKNLKKLSLERRTESGIVSVRYEKSADSYEPMGTVCSRMGLDASYIENNYSVDETETKLVSLSENGKIIEKYRLFSRKKDEKEYCIAFGVKDNEMAYHYSTVPLAKHYIYCTFPTKIDSGLNFLINAPFNLKDNREGICDGDKFNADLIERIATLAGDSLKYLKDLQSLDDTIIDVIPVVKPENMPEIYQAVYKKILAQFSAYGEVEYEKILKNGIVEDYKRVYNGIIPVISVDDKMHYTNRENAYWISEASVLDIFDLEFIKENGQGRPEFPDKTWKNDEKKIRAKELRYPTMVERKLPNVAFANKQNSMTQEQKEYLRLFLPEMTFKNLFWNGYFYKEAVWISGSQGANYYPQPEAYIPKKVRSCDKARYEVWKKYIEKLGKDKLNNLYLELREMLETVSESERKEILSQYPLFLNKRGKAMPLFLNSLNVKTPLLAKEIKGEKAPGFMEIFCIDDKLLKIEAVKAILEMAGIGEIIDWKEWFGMLIKDASHWGHNALANLAGSLNNQEKDEFDKVSFQMCCEHENYDFGEFFLMDQNTNYKGENQSFKCSKELYYPDEDLKAYFRFTGVDRKKEIFYVDVDRYEEYLKEIASEKKIREVLIKRFGVNEYPEVNKDFPDSYRSNGLVDSKQIDGLSEFFNNCENSSPKVSGFVWKMLYYKHNRNVTNLYKFGDKSFTIYSDRYEKKWLWTVDGSPISPKEIFEKKGDVNLDPILYPPDQQKVMMENIGRLFPQNLEKLPKNTKESETPKAEEEPEPFSLNWIINLLEQEGQNKENKENTDPNVNGNEAESSDDREDEKYDEDNKREEQAGVSEKMRGNLLDAYKDLRNNNKSLDSDKDLRNYLPENITFVFGPPGTGKTYYLANEVIKKEIGKGVKILIMTPTNQAADVIVTEVADTDPMDKEKFQDWLVRFGDTENADIWAKGLNSKADLDIEKMGKNSGIALSTTIARFPYASDGVGNVLKNIEWNVIIIDEASMVATENILYPLIKQRQAKFVIVGDPLQIGTVKPLIPDCDNIYELLKLKDYKALWSLEDRTDTGFFWRNTIKGEHKNYPAVKILKKQYRCRPSIVNLFSEVNYNGIVEPVGEPVGEGEEGKRKRKELNFGKFREINLIRFPVSGDIDKPLKKGRSSYHIHSAVAAMGIVNYLKSINKKDFSVGIISPYNAQVDLLNDLIEKEGLEDTVKAGTIHKFQGDACDVIITVWNVPSRFPSGSYREKDNKKKDTMANTRNILNVAVSRPRECLFLLVPEDNVISRLDNVINLIGQCREYKANEANEDNEYCEAFLEMPIAELKDTIKDVFTYEVIGKPDGSHNVVRMPGDREMTTKQHYDIICGNSGTEILIHRIQKENHENGGEKM